MWVGGNCSSPTPGVCLLGARLLPFWGPAHHVRTHLPGRDSEYLPPVFTPPQFPHPPELGTVI